MAISRLGQVQSMTFLFESILMPISGSHTKHEPGLERPRHKARIASPSAVRSDRLMSIHSKAAACSLWESIEH
jgi:hypothetical protein